jgi:hypothetical protein
VSRKCLKNVNRENCTAAELKTLLRRKGLLLQKGDKKDNLLDRFEHPDEYDHPCSHLQTLRQECDKDELVKLFHKVKEGQNQLPNVDPESLTRAQLYQFLHNEKYRARVQKRQNNRVCNDEDMSGCTKQQLLYHVLHKIEARAVGHDLDYAKLKRATRAEVMAFINQFNKKGTVQKKFCMSKRKSPAASRRSSPYRNIFEEPLNRNSPQRKSPQRKRQLAIENGTQNFQMVPYQQPRQQRTLLIENVDDDVFHDAPEENNDFWAGR